MSSNTYSAQSDAPCHWVYTNRLISQSHTPPAVLPKYLGENPRRLGDSGLGPVRAHVVQQLVTDRVEPGLLTLPRVDLDESVAGMLTERVFIMAGSVPFPT